MIELCYSIKIHKPRSFVFLKLQDRSVYAEWAKAWGEGMSYEGEWSEGKFISFFDHVHGGTKVVVEKLIPNELIRMKHIGMVDTKNAVIDLIDEAVQKWMGSLEIYEFKESDQNGTLFEVTMVADESFKDVMDVWPQALTLFKRVCEGD